MFHSLRVISPFEFPCFHLIFTLLKPNTLGLVFFCATVLRTSHSNQIKPCYHRLVLPYQKQKANVDRFRKALTELYKRGPEKKKKKKDPLPKQSQIPHVLRRRKPLNTDARRTYSRLEGIKECGDMKLSKDEKKNTRKDCTSRMYKHEFVKEGREK